MTGAKEDQLPQSRDYRAYQQAGFFLALARGFIGQIPAGLPLCVDMRRIDPVHPIIPTFKQTDNSFRRITQAPLIHTGKMHLDKNLAAT